MRKIVIIPESVCAREMVVTVNNDTIDSVMVQGGCDGNNQAMARLLKGMTMNQAVRLLSNIDCEGKGTSCADQLAKGLTRQLALDHDKV